MINEILSVTDSVGRKYAYQLSDRDEISTVALNRCLRSIYDSFVAQYEDASDRMFELEDEEKTQLVKFQRMPLSSTEEDDVNLANNGEDADRYEDFHGNFADEWGRQKEAVRISCVNYPGQIYRSIRLLGSSSAAQRIDVSYSDDTDPDIGGRYSGEPWNLRKASDPDDGTFGVVGRLWNHSAMLNEETLRASKTDQVLSSGGWSPNVVDVVPVTSYERGIALSEFAPTVASLYADEFPYTLYNLLGGATSNVQSGKYVVPGYGSIEIHYNNVVLNSNIGVSFGKIETKRGVDDYQEFDIDLDLRTTVLESACPEKLLFAQFGNGVCTGVTAVSQGLDGGSPFTVSEVLAPTVMQTGEFEFELKDLTKTNCGDVEYFNTSTGFHKAEGAITNISVSNRSYDLYYFAMYTIRVWKEGVEYNTGDEVMYVNRRYVSTKDNNTSVPSIGLGWSQL